MIVSLDTLVARLREDKFAYEARWLVYCRACDRAIDIWPEKANLACECGERLVALIGGLHDVVVTARQHH